MKCPFCGSDTKVVDKRGSQEAENRRRRECLSCGKRFTTYERMEITPSSITQIKKRDGSLVLFNKEKITNAIFKAAKAVGGKDKDLARKLANEVVEILEKKFIDTIPIVEDVQDIVEKVLIENGHAKTAKAYILYREKHKQIRDLKTTFIDVEDTISEYIEQEHFNVKENANEAYSFSGLMLHTAGKVISNYSLNNIYTKDIREAYVKGYIHIHDLPNGFIGYCCGHSLKNLLLWGFGGVPNKVDCKPAKHMNTLIHHLVNYIGCLQMEFAGAQAFSSVDTLLAPFIKVDNMTFKEVKQCMQQLVFSLNIPSRWGTQFPFSNLTFDWIVPEDLKKEKAIVGGKEQDFTYSDCQNEMDMINKAFLMVIKEGDANGSTFSFPIPTYNLTKDFDWGSENANLLFEVTTKYGTPYFQNYIGSELDPSSVRAMCCRLNINQVELINRPGNMWGPGDSTGSIGVVTMNVNRMAYEAKDKKEFFEKLGYYMDIGKQSLETKRRIITKNLDNGLMPYTKRYLGTWANHFSTIGLCGMNEACLNLIGKDIKSEEGKQLAIDSLNFMRDNLVEFQKETGNLYNLEATPAEGTSYRFARLDKEYCKDIITSGEEAPFLTNSTHLPVDGTDNLIEALEHQNDIQCLYTGGTIFHTFLGERLSDGESCKQLVRRIAYNTKIPYFSMTPSFSVCKDHGYISGEHYTCPENDGGSVCGKSCEVFSRVVGYFRPVQQWNRGKQEEFKFRKTFIEEKAVNNKFKTELTGIKNGQVKLVEIYNDKGN